MTRYDSPDTITLRGIAKHLAGVALAALAGTTAGLLTLAMLGPDLVRLEQVDEGLVAGATHIVQMKVEHHDFDRYDDCVVNGAALC